MTIEIYDYEASSCGGKVRWTLAELGLDHVRHRVDMLEFEHKTAAYLDIHPEGLIPASRFDGTVVLGADEIMLRLAGLRPDRRLAPVAARETIAHWLEVVAGLHASFGPLLYAEIFLPAWARRDPARLDRTLDNIRDSAVAVRTAALIEHGIPAPRLATCLEGVRAAFQATDAQLAGQRWVAGPEFTLADIALFPYVHTPMRRVSDLWFGRLPNLTRWLARMRSRPAFVEAWLNHPCSDELWAAVLAAPGGGGFRPS